MHDFLSLIEAISRQEYDRIRDPNVPFCTVVRLAALTVRVALLSGHNVNGNMLACLMRKTLREELAFHY
ncbi:MAG: hypothetical protein VKJ04_06800 [Vampirovibrionales bacterium]|nr:hypothetical protein [Vampirovibrionales bacterium]